MNRREMKCNKEVGFRKDGRFFIVIMKSLLLFRFIYPIQIFYYEINKPYDKI